MKWSAWVGTEKWAKVVAVGPQIQFLVYCCHRDSDLWFKLRETHNIRV